MGGSSPALGALGAHAPLGPQVSLAALGEVQGLAWVSQLTRKIRPTFLGTFPLLPSPRVTFWILPHSQSELGQVRVGLCLALGWGKLETPRLDLSKNASSWALGPPDTDFCRWGLGICIFNRFPR